jgi:hypothetical protein
VDVELEIMCVIRYRVSTSALGHHICIIKMHFVHGLDITFAYHLEFIAMKVYQQ